MNYRNMVGLISSQSPVLEVSKVDAKNLRPSFKFYLGEVVEQLYSEKDIDKESALIGAVKVKFLYENRSDEDLYVAKPFFPNLSQYPFKGEVVVCFYSMNETGIEGESLYYLSSLNLYGNQNNNVYGDSLFKEEKNDKELERKQVSKLELFEGDFALEGRFGHSIRFGTGVKNDKLKGFPQKKKETDDNPILIISVGRKDNKKLLIVENVNEDKSSIYIVSDHLVEMKFASNKKKTYEEFPEKLEGAQILINSDRVVVNAKKEEVLISAAKPIHLSSNENVLIDAEKEFKVDAEKHLLGKDANEAILLGNKTIKFLEKFIDVLLSTQYYYGCLNPVPLQNLKKELEPLLSKRSFTE